MSFDEKILEFVVNAVTKDLTTKFTKEREDYNKSIEFKDPVNASSLRVVVSAKQLIEPCKAKAKRRRESEAEWTKKLEEAEKELREKGVSVELVDHTGTINVYQNILASGCISPGYTGQQQNFQPQVDQKLLGAVKTAKAKMLEKRGEAVQYEKYARAFSVAPDRPIILSVDDVSYFGLGIDVNSGS